MEETPLRHPQYDVVLVELQFHAVWLDRYDACAFDIIAFAEVNAVDHGFARGAVAGDALQYKLGRFRARSGWCLCGLRLGSHNLFRFEFFDDLGNKFVVGGLRVNFGCG